MEITLHGALFLAFGTWFICEAIKGPQKIFARVALGSLFSVYVISHSGMQDSIPVYALSFLTLFMLFWMFSLKLMYILKNLKKGTEK